MTLIADALQPLIISELNQVSDLSLAVNLPDLIGKQGRYGYYIDFDNSTKSIKSDFRDSTPVVASIAYDIGRFSSAAFQSLFAVRPGLENKEELPWAFIKLYYAAFYAGHAILRMFGSSCSYLDKNHVQYIRNLGVTYGCTPNFTIRSSAYLCTVEPGAASIISTCLRDGGGGAHEVFWHVFGEKLGQLNTKILAGPLSEVESQRVFLKIESLTSRLRSHSTPLHSWLSVIRNEVQYRQDHNLWLPRNILKRDREQFKRNFDQWGRDPMEIDIDMPSNAKLNEFIITCCFIIAVCRELLRRIEERSPNPAQSFPRRGPLAVVKKI